MFIGIFASPFFDLAAFALPFFGAEFEVEADTKRMLILANKNHRLSSLRLRRCACATVGATNRPNANCGSWRCNGRAKELV